MTIARRELLAGSAAAVGTLKPFRLAASVPALAGPDPTAPREDCMLSLDEGWRFHPGDVPPSPIRGHEQSYLNSKAGGARDAAAQDYDDSDWRELSIPHDWAMETPPVPDENSAQGYRRRGIGWYRRTLRLDDASRGRYLELQFGAIATNATIWFNGNVVAHNWSGYNSIYIDITSMALFGDDLNTIAVRVDADRMEGWWYEGAGLYRHVWLAERAPVHIVTDGLHANPRRSDTGRWHVPVTATLYNIGARDAAVVVSAELLDAAGQIVARASAPATVGSLARQEVDLSLELSAPKLWSVDDPNLYQVRATVRSGREKLDTRTLSCGFRTFRFDPATGFHFNDRPLKIRGVCVHQDHGGVGVAVPAAIVDWRVRRLKELGCNAIRSAHNAPNLALLDACDRHGVLVLDENRNFSVAPEYVQQLEWLVRRDRSRACVFMWSVFNEEPMQASEAGYEMVRRMYRVVRNLDDTRPITAAMNDGVFSPVNVSAAVDVVGFNYQQQDYDRFHAAHPALPMTSSEDTCGVMTRGAWFNDDEKHVLASDDTQKASWGATHRQSWRMIDERPFVAGSFVWTGFDYHGEPTPYIWPSKSSSFGIMDLCGFPKTAFAIRQAHWIKDKPVVAIAPHWNWPGREGQRIRVMAITNGDTARLILNGRVVAEGPVDPYDMATFEVTYAPGTLELVALKDGRVHGHAVVETTGSPVALRLQADRRVLDGDARDAQPIRIEAVDARGRPVPTADMEVEVRVVNGRLIGVCNGDPTGVQDAKASSIRLFNGLAQAIVQSEPGSHGRARVEARAPGLRAAAVIIEVRPAKVASVPPIPSIQRVTGWRRSPTAQVSPNPATRLAPGDMNSWANVLAGKPVTPEPASGYSLFAARVAPYKRVAARGGVLRFGGIAGSASIYLDGRLVGRKSGTGVEPMAVPFPPGGDTRSVTLIVDVVQGAPAGLPGVVTLAEK